MQNLSWGNFLYKIAVRGDENTLVEGTIANDAVMSNRHEAINNTCSAHVRHIPLKLGAGSRWQRTSKISGREHNFSDVSVSTLE